jgi:hypothetical protein
MSANAENFNVQQRKTVFMHHDGLEILPPLESKKNHASVDIDKMLVIASLVERVLPKALPVQYRSNWPIELIIESINTAYGYTEAGSRYQPKPEDISRSYDTVQRLLAEMQAAGDQERKWRAAIIGRYRMQSGIRLELDLMPWRDLASWLDLRHDLRISHEGSRKWVAKGIQWMEASL